ncbi:plant intracellular Ras-group-related LRR protein 1-like [Asparagus officinalis]|uniref:plant intracellular Ras-group-related LRR protein 1-like n=1 Tax=Asparagus officinalis TaxID=4686 RepID=UPI00098E246D|nr:plant intracellular Ras-group-related LRR protein 1-like [Asparagus officinalis]
MRMNETKREEMDQKDHQKAEKIDLSGLYLDSLPNSSLNLAAITKLDLSNNNLELIPESLTARLLNVVVLDVHSNQLRVLPNSIGCLSKLKVLNISGNLIESLPKTIEDCSHRAVVLNWGLHSCFSASPRTGSVGDQLVLRLEEVQPSKGRSETSRAAGALLIMVSVAAVRAILIFRPPQLDNDSYESERNCLLCSSDIQRLHHGLSIHLPLGGLIPAFRNMWAEFEWENKSGKDGEACWHKSALKLPILENRANRCENFHLESSQARWYCALTGATNSYLNNKGNTEKELDARLNCIRSLPEDLENLIRLEVLNISQNFHYLESLPYSIGLLISLTELDISYNKITHLPNSVGCLTKLHKFQAEGNPLVFPPMEVVEQSVHAVREYLSARMNGLETEMSPNSKKKSWFKKLVKFRTFNSSTVPSRGIIDENDGFLLSDYRSIDGLTSPRYAGMFSPRRIFCPKRTPFRR